MPSAMKKGSMFLLVVLCNVSLAFAGNDVRGQSGDQIRQHLRDDSCILDATDGNGTADMLFSQRNGIGSSDQDRLRDDSCLDNMDQGNGSDAMLISRRNGGQRGGQGSGDRRRDGSCQDNVDQGNTVIFG